MKKIKLMVLGAVFVFSTIATSFVVAPQTSATGPCGGSYSEYTYISLRAYGGIWVYKSGNTLCAVNYASSFAQAVRGYRAKPISVYFEKRVGTGGWPTYYNTIARDRSNYYYYAGPIYAYVPVGSCVLAGGSTYVLDTYTESGSQYLCNASY